MRMHRTSLRTCPRGHFRPKSASAGRCNRLLLLLRRSLPLPLGLTVVVPALRVSWAVTRDVAGVVAEVADPRVWPREGSAAVRVVIQAVGTAAPCPELAHALGGIVVDDAPLRMVIEATLALAPPAESARVQGRVDITTLWMCVRTVAPLAAPPEAARLSRLQPQHSLLLALPRALLHDVLRDGAEARGQAVGHALLGRLVVLPRRGRRPRRGELRLLGLVVASAVGGNFVVQRLRLWRWQGQHLATGGQCRLWRCQALDMPEKLLASL
mmetsp:Transcript_58013/g.164847  ORF Transcript_58013/g.164847 Transcript_58013/m.164847 type:complete len:269 (+) Transcript_58013:51-857(+)